MSRINKPDDSKSIKSNSKTISNKMAFKFGKLLDNQKYEKTKLTVESRLFDEVDWIEEEFNNIYVRFMRFLLEKFNNLVNNIPIENLFLCVMKFINILEFDFDYYIKSISGS